ncbi:MAG: cyclase family protein [Bacteroidota bacterium]
MHILELTHQMYADMPVFPGTPQPSFIPVHTIQVDKVSQMEIRTYSHMGTHIDAPFHMVKDGKKLDDFPITQFIGSACLIDCSKNEGLEIPKSFLEEYEEKIRQVDFVILYTGWSQYWGTPKFFEPYPCLSEEAAKWLASFTLKGIGLDTCSVDQIDETYFKIHYALFDNEFLIIENLANLDTIEKDIFEFSALPLKIANADGCPVRAFARY